METSALVFFIMANPRLIFSLAANGVLLCLLGGVLYTTHAERKEIPVPPQAAAPFSPQPVLASAATPDPKPFRWSQLESTDYATYIANLRKIECPEKTIRDIIAADMGDLFTQKRQNLLAQSQGGQDLSKEWDQLQRQQQDILVKLLGPQPTPPASAQTQSPSASTALAPAALTQAPATAPATISRTSQPRLDISVPAVLLPPDSSLQLTAQQKETWSALSKEFVQAIGGPNQDPNSSAYLRNWRKAQLQADDLFRATFGQDAFLKQQVQAAQAALP